MRVQIPKFVRDVANVQMMKYRVAGQKGRVTKLEGQVRRLTHLVKDDILTLQDKTTKYKGNEYTSYKSAVEEINKKYNGTADWGVLQTGSIIDLRAAFIIGEGLKIVKKADDADAEYEWVEKFLEYNDLDKEVAQEFAKEAEIEGKLAMKLILEKIPDPKEGEEKYAVSARYVSWTENNYTIKTNPQDYMKYENMTWKPKTKDKIEVLEAKDFVYKKFGGRINKPNLSAPKIMKCLTQIENLDKALRDWREINRIFAGPILGVECKDAKDVKSAQDALLNKNWKIKKVFIATAKLYFAQFNIKGVESLENEIITLSKMISGTTGIPVHFLGLPELMSNRAVAENLMELIHAATMKERETWKGAYEEIIAKAMRLFNEKENKGMSKAKQLDPAKIGVEIPMITKEHWDHLEKIYLPAVIAGKISDEAFQEKIPGFDIEADRKRKEIKEASEFERIKKENEDLKANLAEKEIFGEEGGENAL